MSDLPERLLHAAIAELACPRCLNRGSITVRDELDECPECHGDKRNSATIALLTLLVAQREALAAERERCARIAETLDEGDRQTAAFVHAQNIAAAIRGDQ